LPDSQHFVLWTALSSLNNNNIFILSEHLGILGAERFASRMQQHQNGKGIKEISAVLLLSALK